MSILKSVALKTVATGIDFPLQVFDRIGEFQTLRDLLADLKVDCVIDVGANRGQFASELRGIGFRGDIVSFEPLQAEFEFLNKAFAGDPRFRSRRMALGGRSERLEIVVPGLTVLASLRRPNFQSRNSRSEMVDVGRLDQVLPELMPDWASRRLFLKMDTQGYDLEVFKGGRAVLSGIVGLQSELSVLPLYEGMPHYLEALATFEAAGFELHNLAVVNRSADNGVIELNCQMRKPVAVR